MFTVLFIPVQITIDPLVVIAEESDSDSSDSEFVPGTIQNFSSPKGIYQPDFTSDSWSYKDVYTQIGYLGQCTWFAWHCFYEFYGYMPCFTGNGYECAQELATGDENFTISDTPKPGTIVSFVPNHVAFICSVYDDGTMDIWEGNSNTNNESSLEQFLTVRGDKYVNGNIVYYSDHDYRFDYKVSEDFFYRNSVTSIVYAVPSDELLATVDWDFSLDDSSEQAQDLKNSGVLVKESELVGILTEDYMTDAQTYIQFTDKNDLTLSEQARLADLKLEINDTKDGTVYHLFNKAMMFLALVILIVTTVLNIAHMADKSFPYLDIQIVTMLTFGRLVIASEDEDFDYHGKSDNKVFMKEKRFYWTSFMSCFYAIFWIAGIWQDIALYLYYLILSYF
jgi:surface antigen